MADERPYQSNSAASVRPAPATPKRKALPPVSAAERDRITRTITYAKENAPAVVDMVKDMYEAGLIPGWRAVSIKEVDDAIN